MRRVILTGGTGFIGRACVAPLLARGLEVHILSRHSFEASPFVTSHMVDFFDVASVSRIMQTLSAEFLIHAAWDVSTGQFWADRNNFAWLGASTLLLDAFVSFGGKRAIGIGSCAEYGNAETRHVEDDEATPASPYGYCKHGLQKLFTAAAGAGISTVWARLFYPYGDYEKENRLIPSVIRALRAGQPFKCTEGTQLRDFIHVQDVGEAIVSCLEAKQVCGIVNICTGEAVSVREVISLIAAEFNALGLVEFGAIPMNPHEPKAMVGSATRLRQEVNFSPRIGLGEGVTRTIKFWRQAI